MTQTRFERRKQATRQRLKQTALDLMAEQGYDAVSVQDITDGADVGRGTFYIHFKDKEDILWTMLRESMDELHAQIEREFRAEQSVDRRVYRIWLTTFQHIHAHRDLMHIVFGERGHTFMANRLMDYFAALMIEDLTANIHRLPIKLPAPFVANYLLGAQMRLIVWWLEQGQEYTAEQIADMFYEFTTQSPAPH